MKKKEKAGKAYFVQRLAAYLIDMIIISVIAALVTLPFTNGSTLKKLDEQSKEVMENYVNQKIDLGTYFIQSMDLGFERSKAVGFSNVITIIILVLYFIVFQIYNNGQTLGKKIMKIKIIKNDGSNLSMNDMIIRELINNFILADILVAIVILLGKDIYFYGTMGIELIQYIVLIVTVIMIINRKDGRGLADLLVNTKVVNFDDVVKEEIVCES